MNALWIVMKKELTELKRDRRVRSNVIFMPMFLVIGMLTLFGFVSGVGEVKNQKIHVVHGNNSAVKHLRDNQFQIIELASVEDGQKLIREGKARLVLDFETDFDTKLKAESPTQVQAYYDPQQQTGEIALRITQGALAELNAGEAAKVLAAKGLTPQSIAPIQIKENKVKVGKEGASEFLISLLPYFIVIWAFYGGFGTASDLVAGEKEKMTLETLLIAPVGRTQIAMGKFLSLATICFLSSFSAVLGFLIAGSSGLPMFAKLFPHGLGMGLPEIATILIVLIPTVAFFASLLLAVSTFAKNSRECQSYLAIISFIVIMPAIFGQFIGLTDLASNWWIRLVPVLNTSISVREALQGKTNAIGILITVAVGAILALIAIRIAVKLFKREAVLTRI